MHLFENKYFQLLVFGIFLLSSGYAYSEFYRPKEVGGVPPTGKVVMVEMRVLKDKWKWEPEEIKIQAGDRVRVHIFNEDDYDHGFAIDVLGVNRRLFPLSSTLVEFAAPLRGKFNFYCSVPCGEGHYDQIGILFVE